MYKEIETNDDDGEIDVEVVRGISQNTTTTEKPLEHLINNMACDLIRADGTALGYQLTAYLQELMIIKYHPESYSGNEITEVPPEIIDKIRKEIENLNDIIIKYGNSINDDELKKMSNDELFGR